MELVPKQGWIFVKSLESDHLGETISRGQVASGIKEIGMEVFFEEYVVFKEDEALLLVKIEDVLAWVKPEVVVDEPKDDQA